MSFVRPTPVGLVLDPEGAPAEGLAAFRQLCGDADDEALPWGRILPLLELEPGSSPEGDERDLVILAHELAHHAGLPQLVAPDRVEVDTVGSFVDDGFHFRWTFHLDGEPFDASWLEGAWYRGRTREVLLPYDHWRLWEGLSRDDPGSSAGRQLWWAELRPLAAAVGAELEAYLRDSDARRIRRIRPRFRSREDGGLDLLPEAEGVPADDFENALGASRRVRRQLNVRRPDGGRTRLHLDDKAQEGLQRVLARPSLSRTEAAEVLENPEQFFDPEIFDLSEYSERVLGVGPPRYTPLVAVQVAEDAGDWFEGVVERVEIELTNIAHPEEPPKRVDITSPEVRRQAAQVVEEAVSEGREFCELFGNIVRITPDLRVAVAELPEAGERIERRSRFAGHVLLIRENVEVLEFGGASELPTMPDDYAVRWPPLVDGEPLEHQLRGFRQLRWWSEDASTPIAGGLLADDMGLGKTFQVLSLLGALAEQGDLRPSLVVAPASVIENWLRETVRFVPSLAGRVVDLREVPKGEAAHAAESVDVIVTSYETLARRDIEMGRITWRVVVCDEAQKIKNPHTRVAHAAKAMKADFRLAMTGTPVENTLEELWSVSDFFQPGLLGSLADFRKRYDASVLKDNTRRDAAAEELRSRLSPVFLRRMKADVPDLQLPQLARREHRVPMSRLQRQVYEDCRRPVLQGNLDAIAAIQRMLQACAHPFPLRREQTAGEDPVEHCPKLAKTLEILETVREQGDKAIVFVRWMEWQLLIEAVIRARFGIDVPVLNGSVDASRRQGVVDAFGRQPGFGVMILSARACGTGLNITAANHVIHYTREWNPAIEAQATDRVHRIGQDRPVTVHIPIVEGDGFRSAEEILADRLREKDALRVDFVRPSRELSIRPEDFLEAIEPVPIQPESVSGQASEAPPGSPESEDPLVAELRESEAFRSQAQQGANVDPEIALRAVAALLAEGCSMSDHAFAQAMSMRPRRVAGLVARMGALLNIDGYTVVRHDPSAQQVTLALDRLRLLFGLSARPTQG